MNRNLSYYYNQLAIDDIYVEFRPFKGWYASFSEARWFQDEGEYLGATESEIEYALDLMELQRPLTPYERLALQGTREKPALHSECLSCVEKLAVEEVHYWISKTSTAQGRKAFRILFNIK